MKAIALAVALAFSAVPSLAFADTTRFMCHTETAVNAIAEQVVKGDDAADDAIAQPYTTSGECIVLPVDIEIEISYRGKIYKGKDGFEVQVIGFPVPGSTTVTWYGIMPVEPVDAVHRKHEA